MTTALLIFAVVMVGLLLGSVALLIVISRLVAEDTMRDFDRYG